MSNRICKSCLFFTEYNLLKDRNTRLELEKAAYGAAEFCERLVMNSMGVKAQNEMLMELIEDVYQDHDRYKKCSPETYSKILRVRCELK